MPLEIPQNTADKGAGKQPQKDVRPDTNNPGDINLHPAKTIDRPGPVDAPIFDDAVDASDDIEKTYLLSRQIAHEFHSPAVQELIKLGIDPQQFQKKLMKTGKPKTEQDVADEKKQAQQDKFFAEAGPGVTPESVAMGKKVEPNQALIDPAIDPTAAFAGGFGGVTSLSIRQGLKLMPSLGRGLVSGVVGAAADYPIGAATESIEEVAPGAALPFNVIAGMISGATLESAIEKSVIKYAGKGLNSPRIKKLASSVYEELLSGEPKTKIGKKVNEEIQFALKKYADQTGAIGDLDGNEFDKAITAATKPTKTDLFLDDSVDYMPGLNIRRNKTGDALLAGNINLDRIDSPQSIDKELAKVEVVFKDKISDAKRGVITNEETQRLADLSGVTVKTLLKRRKGQAFNAEEALAARKILVSSAENLVQMARRVKSLDATDAEKFAFRKALNTHYSIQAQVSGLTAEAGRALQAFNITAASGEQQTKAIKDLLNNMPDGMSIDKMADHMSTFEFAEQVGAYAKQASRATTYDMFMEAWINGLLSGPQTHVVNSVSNSMVALLQIPERAMGAGISKLFRTSEGVEAGEAAAQAYGLIEGFKDGIKAFGRVIKTGEPSDALEKIEVRKYRAITSENFRQLPIIKQLSPTVFNDGGVAGQAMDLMVNGAGSIIRTPGKFLSAEDELFKSIGYRMELRSRAYRTAKQEGLQGDEFAERVTAILADPQTEAPDVHLAAANASRYQTFTKPLGDAGQNIQQFFNRMPAAKLISPFIRTPANIMKFAGERTPLAWLSRNVREELAAGGARRDMAIAKMATGSMVMATTATLAAQGHITGGGPADPKAKATLRRQGWQPYSVKIGDKYVSYNRVEPLGMLMGVAADFAEIAGLAGDEMAPELDRLAAAIVMSFSKNVTSKTWLRGVSSAIEAIEDPQRYGAQWIQGYARSTVPAIVAQAERTISPEMEAVYSLSDAIRARIPGLSKDLPPRRDFWANPISSAIGGKRGWLEAATSAVNPFYISQHKESPIDKELLRIGLPLSKPQRVQTFEGVQVELYPFEYDQFIVSMNEIKLGSTNMNLKDSLDYLVTKDQNYQTYDDGLKEIVIRHKVNEAKQLAKIELLRNVPAIRTAIDQKKAEDVLNP